MLYWEASGITGEVEAAACHRHSVHAMIALWAVHCRMLAILCQPQPVNTCGTDCPSCFAICVHACVICCAAQLIESVVIS